MKLPPGYTYERLMKVFTCNNFLGMYPVPTAAVMVANDKESARKLLQSELDKLKLDQHNNSLEINEIEIDKENLIILSIGNY